MLSYFKSNQIKSNQIKSNQIKSNQIKSNQKLYQLIILILTIILSGCSKDKNQGKDIGDDSFFIDTSLFNKKEPLVANRDSFAYLNPNGTVISWGKIGRGGIGPIDGSFTQITSTGTGFAAIRVDGSIHVWGEFNEDIPGNFTQVTVSGRAFAALKNDGSCIYGLVDTHSDNYNGPKEISDNFKEVIINNKAYAAIRSDGSIYSWMWSSSYTPMSIPGDFIKVVANSSAQFAALDSNGSIYTWQLSSLPSEISKIDGRFRTVVTNYGAFSAIKDDGTIYSWGGSSFGAKGSISGNFKEVISVGSSSFAAIKNDGSIYIWDGNDDATITGNFKRFFNTGADSMIVAEKANGTLYYFSYDKSRGGVINEGSIIENFTSVAVGSNNFYALRSNGSIYEFKSLGDYEKFNDSFTNVVIIESVNNYNDTTFIAQRSDGSLYVWGRLGSIDIAGKFTQIVTGRNGFAALRDNGDIYYWTDTLGGSDIIGEFTQISRFGYEYMSSFVALKDDGSLYTFGDLMYGSPPYVDKYIQISGNYSGFAAIRDDGSIDFWSISNPFATNIPGKFTQIVTNFDSILFVAIRDNGDIYSWVSENSYYKNIGDIAGPFSQIIIDINGLFVRKEESIMHFNTYSDEIENKEITGRFKNMVGYRSCIFTSKEGDNSIYNWCPNGYSNAADHQLSIIPMSDGVKDIRPIGTHGFILIKNDNSIYYQATNGSPSHYGRDIVGNFTQIAGSDYTFNSASRYTATAIRDDGTIHAFVYESSSWRRGLVINKTVPKGNSFVKIINNGASFIAFDQDGRIFPFGESDYTFFNSIK